MINYAHRGACEYAPENTLSAFYLGLLQGANGIETDVRRTRDGELVLFHDDTLERLTDGFGPMPEKTLAELKALRVFGKSTTDFYDRIPTYREFLEHFASYDISFAIELKADDVEEDVLRLSKEFDLLKKATFTAFSFDRIARIKALCPEARVGWLIRDPEPADIEKLLALGGEEVCPMAECVTEEKMAYWRSVGLGVRAWYIKGVVTMKRMCKLGVDGMTVNFPDRLHALLRP